ncbi:MAG: hypothetical protein R8K22_08875, partial [Mariprofundaceae bacterium]
MNIYKYLSMLICLMAFSSFATARVLPGWFDLRGNPVHTADEVDVQVNTVVQPVAQGYRYSYTVTSLPSSLQNLVVFEIALPDPYSVIAGTETSPWPNSQG